MELGRLLVPAAVAATLLFSAGNTMSTTPSRQDLLRDLLRQQTTASRDACSGVQRTIRAGSDAVLVVRTAVEIGYNPCQVIRCALMDGADLVKVIEGAVASGVGPDVISRCSVEAGANPTAVAAIFAGLVIEPNFCYFSPRPAAPPPEALPPVVPTVDRELTPVEFSPYTP